MPNLINKNFMEIHVPRIEGEMLKAWLHRVSIHFGFCLETARYYYHDKRSKRLASHLLVKSDRLNQKVQCDLQQLSISQVETYADAFKQIHDVLKSIAQDLARHG